MPEAHAHRKNLYRVPLTSAGSLNGPTVAETSRVRWLSHATQRIRTVAQQRGFWGATQFLLSRIYRREVSLVFEAELANPRPPVLWRSNEQVLQFGPENVDQKLTAELRTFLGGQEAIPSIEGVRGGDRLFVVESGGQYLHHGYILFKTRGKKVIGEERDAPMIAYCRTSPAARGRGIYRKALGEELNYLQREGYNRAIIVTWPENIASRKGIEAAGFSFAWEARVWILLNLAVVRCITTKTGKRWRAFLL